MRAGELRAGAIQLVVFARSTEDDGDDLDARLGTLALELLEAPETEAGARGLQRVARGLLRLRSEAAAAGGGQGFRALALVDSVDSPAVAYVGDEPPAITLDGFPLPALWRALNDAAGGRARAAVITAGRLERFSLASSGGPKSGGEPAWSLDATWDREAPEVPADQPAPAAERSYGERDSDEPSEPATPFTDLAQATESETGPDPTPASDPADATPLTSILRDLKEEVARMSEPVATELPRETASAEVATDTAVVDASPLAAPEIPVVDEPAAASPSVLGLTRFDYPIPEPPPEPDPLEERPRIRAIAPEPGDEGKPGPLVLDARPEMKPLPEESPIEVRPEVTRLDKYGVGRTLDLPPSSAKEVKAPPRTNGAQKPLPKFSAIGREPKREIESDGKLEIEPPSAGLEGPAGRGVSLPRPSHVEERRFALKAGAEDTNGKESGKPASRAEKVAGSPRVFAPRREWRLKTSSIGLRVHVWVLVGILACLFVGGFLVGSSGSSSTRVVTTLSPLSHALSTVGLVGSYVCSISSTPDGADVLVDGKTLRAKSPVDVELSPGEHRVTLSLAQQGEASFQVTGNPHQHVALTPELWGSIVVNWRPGETPVKVSVDGISYGRAPILIDHLSPGPHVVQFNGAGLLPTDRTVDVKILHTTEVAVRPVRPPATGIVRVSAVVDGNDGTETVRGARVWVDGSYRGRTPLKLELPYGPHSVRSEYTGEQAPIQVIDLPGGNERFAEFHFGAAGDPTRLTAGPSRGKSPAGSPQVAIVVRGVRAGDLVGVWLHAPGRDGIWRRRRVPVQPTENGVTGVVAVAARGSGSASRIPYYVSALKVTGEEYFTELQSIGARARARTQAQTD